MVAWKIERPQIIVSSVGCSLHHLHSDTISMDPLEKPAGKPRFEDKMGKEGDDDWRVGRLKFTEMVTGCSSRDENPGIP